MGIKHNVVVVSPNNPAKEVSKDAWNDAHGVEGDFDIAGAASVPGSPSAGSIRQFVKITGTSPNKNVVVGYKLEDGTVITLVDVTI